MADLGYGGRVLAGEDSEEDDEEELGFHLGGFGAQQGATNLSARFSQPKFGAPAPSVVAAVSGEAESDEDDEDEEMKKHEDDETREAKTTDATTTAAAAAIGSQGDDVNAPQTSERTGSEAMPPAQIGVEDDDAAWYVDPAMPATALMGQAIVHKLKPSLDATIHRIAELTESQERLLLLLSRQNRAVCANPDIENVAIVMNKLPQYIRKVQDMKAAMTEISASVDRMRHRSESLRVDAQSHAIKKAAKRESQSQWNKLSATKSYATASTTLGDTSQPPPM